MKTAEIDISKIEIALNHLKNYINYDDPLFGVIADDGVPRKLVGWNYSTINLAPSKHGYTHCRYKDFKPFLRDMDSIVTQITHKGETFTPLVRLYEMAYRSCGIGHDVKYDVRVCDNEEGTYGLVVHEEESGFRNGFTFNFLVGEHLNKVVFDLSVNNEQKGSAMWTNQLELLEKLFEWKFNVFDLPEALFIKVTENNNPYK